MEFGTAAQVPIINLALTYSHTCEHHHRPSAIHDTTWNPDYNALNSIGLKLLSHGLALQTLRARENIETRRVMPPHLRTGGPLATELVIIDLTDKLHRSPAALWHLLVLNP